MNKPGSQISDSDMPDGERSDPSNIAKIAGDHNLVFQGNENVTFNINPPPIEKLKRLSKTDAAILEFTSSLKDRYQKRYLGKLDGRFEITLEVSEDWRSDKPQTHKFDATAKISNAMDAIRKAFNEKGRLLIVGSPGSGKTVLLLKLAIEILKNAKPENSDPFPVIFNLASWREDFESFEDWLVDVLNSGNGLSKDFARELLQKQKIILFLDGLDELARNEPPEEAAEIRAKCMASLNSYPYLTHGHELVICCRKEEFAAMHLGTAQDAPVSAKVEVLELTPADIEIALHEAKKEKSSRDAAGHIEKYISENPGFLDILKTPFFFTTALEVFDQPNPQIEGFPKEDSAIKGYLMDRFIDQKLRRNKSTYHFEKAITRHWLIRLAQLMENNQIVTFELSNLSSDGLRTKMGIKILGKFIVTFVVAIVFFHILGWYSILLGLLAMHIHGTDFVEEKIRTEDRVTFRFPFAELISPMIQVSIFFSFIGFCALSRFATLPVTLDERQELPLFIFLSSYGVTGVFSLILGCLVFGLSIGIPIGLFAIASMFWKKVKNIEPLPILDTPYRRLSGGFGIWLLRATLFVFFLAILILFLNYHLGHVATFNFLWVVCVFPIFSILKTPLVRHVILRFTFYLEGAMPLKYATFLDHCAAARILEKEGGHWRFRHQNLQDHFAKMDSAAEAERN